MDRVNDVYPIPEFLRQPVEAPRERPILFSAPMIKALLAGAKTQTRRVVKPQPAAFGENGGPLLRVVGTSLPSGNGFDAQYAQDNPRYIGCCPYGKPGDRLWVREAWRPNWTIEHGHVIEFAADNAVKCFNGCCNDMQVIEPGYSWLTRNYDCYLKPWRPSIHMHRWASRILLEIVAVRTERLSDISRNDAEAEGVGLRRVSENDYRWIDYADKEGGWTFGDPRYSFWSLWKSINGKDSHDANPWVWCLTFKRV